MSQPRRAPTSAPARRDQPHDRRAAKARRLELAKRRFDVLLGVLIGLIAVLLLPGVAAAALVALLVLAVLGVRAAILRRRRRRAPRRPRASSPPRSGSRGYRG